MASKPILAYALLKDVENYIYDKIGVSKESRAYNNNSDTEWISLVDPKAIAKLDIPNIIFAESTEEFEQKANSKTIQDIPEEKRHLLTHFYEVRSTMYFRNIYDGHMSAEARNGYKKKWDELSPAIGSTYLIGPTVVLNKKAAPGDIIEYLKKNPKNTLPGPKDIRYNRTTTGGQLGKCDYGGKHMILLDVEGVVSEDHYNFDRMKYDLVYWKKRKAYLKRMANPVKKVIARDTVLSARIITSMYYMFLHYLLEPTTKKLRKKLNFEEYNENKFGINMQNKEAHPLEEMISVSRLPNHHLLFNNKAHTMRRIYKLLLVLKEYNRRESVLKKQAVKDFFTKYAKAIESIKAKRVSPKNESTKPISFQNHLLGYEGCVVLRYYKMFLKKKYKIK